MKNIKFKLVRFSAYLVVVFFSFSRVMASSDLREEFIHVWEQTSPLRKNVAAIELYEKIFRNDSDSSLEKIVKHLIKGDHFTVAEEVSIGPILPKSLYVFLAPKERRLTPYLT